MAAVASTIHNEPLRVRKVKYKESSSLRKLFSMLYLQYLKDLKNMKKKKNTSDRKMKIIQNIKQALALIYLHKQSLFDITMSTKCVALSHFYKAWSKSSTLQKWNVFSPC